MYTVTSVFTSEYRVKGSKFLGFLCHASGVDQTETHLDSIKREHPIATHHCYAYLLDPNEPVIFSTDAGEPGGTAGVPILNTLRSNDLMNVILIVVRYYGGTKLGKSGLIDAYQATAQQTIQSARLKTLTAIKIYSVEYNYSQQSLIDKWKNRFTLFELESSYLETVELTLGCPNSESNRFETTVNPHTHQLIRFEPAGESFYIG